MDKLNCLKSVLFTHSLYLCTNKYTKMYILTEEIIAELKSNMNLRMKVGLAMGNGEPAVSASMKRNSGKAIAEHYDAVNKIIDETGLTINDVRVEFNEEKQTA